MFFAKNWIRMVAATIFGAVIMIIYVALQSNVILPETNQPVYPWDKLIHYVNGLFIAGALIAFVSLLILLSSFGSFNIFSFYLRRKKKENGFKENYYEYSERVEKTHSSYRFIFIPYLLVGLVFIAIALTLYFVAIGK